MNKVVLLFLLVSVIFLAGCTKINASDDKYKNDIITIENYHLADKEPYTGSSESIDFDIKNNGDKNIDEVRVNFFDMTCSNIQGFRDTLTCDGVSSNNRECIFKNLEHPDWKNVRLDIITPSVNDKTPCSVSFSVSYRYSGARLATMPIIDGVTRLTPLENNKFDQGKPTYGPILLEFEPPVGRITKKDSQEIKEYWGIIGKPFEVNMNFRYASDVSLKDPEPVKIAKNDIWLELGDLNIANIGGTPLHCDFKNGISTKDVVVDADPKNTGKLVCSLQSDSTQPEVGAKIGVNFSYNYRFVVTENFDVHP